ncbi:MAG TPA: ABC transporter ATP-binding protein [Candidatus Angelobacter sp.]|nr:ABC transporter ATP-binding protein [Candidatus Angelobacter sp.]
MTSSGSASTNPATPLLRVQRLTVQYQVGRGALVPALHDISFDLASQEGLGILGESGSGKSSLALALLRLLPENATTSSGTVQFAGTDLLALSRPELRRVRGAEIALISQEPALALNPVLSIGRQMEDVLRAHSPMAAQQRRERITEILGAVGFPDPARIIRAYPHQLSGGQKQRAAIAQALVCRPSLLIADEPLSSLDSVTQAEIVDLLLRLKRELKLALIFITHNAGVLPSICERALVMRDGAIAASATLAQLRTSADPYVAGLQFPESELSPDSGPRGRSTEAPLVQVRNLNKSFTQQRFFSRRKFPVHALKGIDFEIHQGETIAVIGRSGSGKSTLARCLAGFERPDSGEILIEGRAGAPSPRVQMMFQDSGTALNPRFTAAQLIAEPLDIMGSGAPAERGQRALALMKEVGLDPETHNRPAGQFSGGQRQRIALARSLAANPKVLVLDEAFSGLDLPLQARMLRLLLEVQKTHHLAYVFITHDLSFVPLFADRVAVMEDGRIVEWLSPSRLNESSHPEARRLIEAGERLHAPALEAAL